MCSSNTLKRLRKQLFANYDVAYTFCEWATAKTTGLSFGNSVVERRTEYLLEMLIFLRLDALFKVINLRAKMRDLTRKMCTFERKFKRSYKSFD